MRTRRMSKSIYWSVIASMVMSCVAIAASGAPAAAPAPSKEMRAKMATLHEQMAVCLRSDKLFSDCRHELMQGCQQLMGEHGCPMMGMGMHNQMMKEPSSTAPKD